MNRVVFNLGACRVCGKMTYETRADAKLVNRRSYPAEKMSVYRCEGGFHLGHLPKGVTLGLYNRQQLRRTS